MAVESVRARKRRAGKIISGLKKAYPDAHCALLHRNPLQLLIATILSAQCTDKRVNMVTPGLFKKYPNADAFRRAKPRELEQVIRSTGFYRNKAKNIIACCRDIVEKHGGRVPNSMEALTRLAGIGRKTANVVLGNAFGIPGLVVDTHVIRISNLLKLTKNKDAVKIEYDLMPVVPKKDWTLFSHLVISHGRACCVARNPNCKECPISTFCPSSAVK